MEHRQITLYASESCTRCRLVERMLNMHNVIFDVVTDTDVMKAKGYEEFPVLEVDDKILDGYPYVLSWLRKNNYYLLEEGEDESY